MDHPAPDPTLTSFQPGDAVSFRGAIDRRESYATLPSLLGGLLGAMGPSGSAPSPFDALDGSRLAGPDGSHPLALVDPAELLVRATGGLAGGIELDGPVRVGEGISGRIRVTPQRDIAARGVTFRLVGVRLAEEQRSETRSTQSGTSIGVGGVSVGVGGSSSQTQETERWVEVHGSEIESLPFTQPVLPATLSAGQALDLPFSVPAPRLGPPSAHAGTALIAWALEAHWDIGFGGDERVAVLVDVRQHPDLLRAGVVAVGSGAMDDVVTDEGASLSVTPLPPVPAGSAVQLTVSWPGAPDGRSARVELTGDVSGPASISVTPVSIPLDREALKTGTTIAVPIPSDAPPTFEGAGVQVGYRLRVIIDRRLRSDVTAERPIVVC